MANHCTQRNCFNAIPTKPWLRFDIAVHDVGAALPGNRAGASIAIGESVILLTERLSFCWRLSPSIVKHLLERDGGAAE